MKRVFSVLMICALMCAMFAGCNNQPTPSTPDTTPNTTPSTVPTTVPTEPAVQLPASALEMMETIYNAWDFEYKSYFMGGGYSSMVEGAPGAVPSTDTETLQFLLFVPENCLADVKDAASYVHAMNYSVFTSAAFQVDDAAAFCTKLKEGLDSTQWVCGAPEYLLLYTLGNEYVLFVMGTGENIEAYRPALQAAYPDAVAVFDGLMG